MGESEESSTLQTGTGVQNCTKSLKKVSSSLLLERDQGVVFMNDRNEDLVEKMRHLTCL